MPKMIPPQGLKEIAVKTERGTKLYKADRSGLINVENPKHAAQMKHEGLGEASLMGATGNPNLGFNCTACGFGSWFKKCSRCGHDNERIEMDGSSG
jgi:hypothetical protein